MNKILSYFVFCRLTKGHGKLNKGNSDEPFVYQVLRGCPRARKIKFFRRGLATVRQRE